MKAKVFNHVALLVADVEASGSFYKQVLGLEEIPRPAFDFPGMWLGFDGNRELHLIGGREEPVVSDPRGLHWALEIESMDDWERYLDSIACPYTPRRTRPDGAFQIYVKDPDGYYVELTQLPRGGTR
jgi:lactoylglutathione lyase